ncbi:MAG: dihydrofolate reductase [Lutibacter sp.]|jgi:dihydrofolate reductase|nr:dihydrofolate reductase [Lutibacter sp.]
MISLIAAIARNRALGKDNKLLCHLPADLKRFKQVTGGHHVIMGRKTYESLGKPLPNRTNIVISRNKAYTAKGCLVVHSLEAALEAAGKDDNPYILGGAEIYRQALAFADELDLTLIHADFEADAFFPAIDPELWQELNREDHKADLKNPYDYSFVTYRKNKK